MKTDYTQELHDLITSFFTPVESLEQANKETLKKTLEEIHQDVTNVLPAVWVNTADVHKALKDLNFKAFPFKNDQDKTTFYYYLQPK